MSIVSSIEIFYFSIDEHFEYVELKVSQIWSK